ncbi:MAG: anthranilate synthase component I family protein [Rhodoglobus sp.]
MRPRVLTASLGRWVDPSEAYLAICGDADNTFWLDSGVDAVSGVSYLGVAASTTTDFDGPVLDWLRERQAAAPERSSPPEFQFSLGWVGWLSYELRAETMGVAVSHPPRYPLAAWHFIERCLAFNHATQEVTLLALDNLDSWRLEVEAALHARECSTSARADVVQPTTVEHSRPSVTWAYSDERYLEMIRECQEAIREGEAYQLCLTTEACTRVSPDPVQTYLALRASSSTHHGALLRAHGVSVLSASPEQFLAVSPDGVVSTSPIKGTRPRGVTPGQDEQLRDELRSSDKERAENLMIVDLMRNDIGRISRVGSVAVTSLLTVESYAHVHQLVSTVQGELADGLTGVDAIAACFPAGSMTGAPKRRATEILDRLERRPRGIYAGALGYLGLDGAVDLAMVIRSIVIDTEGSTVGAGGGITALSVPEEELAEAKLKAQALLRALGASEPSSR